MNEPLISIIIPVYNVEKYLCRCIDSVLNQTYKNIEIILIDDGSPDNCPKICDDYEKKDRRVKVIHQTNAGVSAARNSGLEIAKGEYISFVDSDDWIDSGFIETLYCMLISSASEMAVAVPHVKTFAKWDDALFGNPKVLSQTEFLKYMLLNEIRCSEMWGKLFSTSLIKDLRFNINISNGEDTLMLVHVCQKSKTIVVMNYDGYHYTCRNYSASHKYRDSFWSLQTACDLIIQELSNSTQQLICYALSRSIRLDISFAFLLLDNGKLDEKNYYRIKDHIKKYDNERKVMILSIKDRIILLFKCGRIPFIVARRTWNLLKVRKMENTQLI